MRPSYYYQREKTCHTREKVSFWQIFSLCGFRYAAPRKIEAWQMPTAMGVYIKGTQSGLDGVARPFLILSQIKTQAGRTTKQGKTRYPPMLSSLPLPLRCETNNVPNLIRRSRPKSSKFWPSTYAERRQSISRQVPPLRKRVERAVNRIPIDKHDSPLHLGLAHDKADLSVG